MKLLFKNILLFLTGSSLFVIFAVVLVSSLSRYLFNAPLQWSEEIARYGMIYGTMFGTIVCYLEGRHIKFDFLENAIPDHFKKSLGAVTDIAVLASGVMLTWSGYLFAAKRGGISAPGTGIDMYYFQAAMAIGGVGLIIAAFIRLSEHFPVNSK